MIIPLRFDANEAWRNYTAPDISFRCEIASVIWQGIFFGATDTGSNISLVSPRVISNDLLLSVQAELEALGYTVTYPDDTHITIGWE